MANYEVKETTIQGRKYTLPVMPGIRGRKVILRIMRVVGPLADVGLSKPKDDEDGEPNKKSVGEILVAILANLDDATFDWILRELVQGGFVQGNEPDSMLQLSFDATQNMVWGDNEGYLAMVDFIKWALEINFSGFINGLRAKFKSPKKDSPAASQTTQ